MASLELLRADAERVYVRRAEGDPILYLLSRRDGRDLWRLGD